MAATGRFLVRSYFQPLFGYGELVPVMPYRFESFFTEHTPIHILIAGPASSEAMIIISY
jgi:hypothetical protein